MTKKDIILKNYLPIQAIILAAGNSSRFNTNKSKLCYKLCGQELILYPLKALEALEIPATVILGNPQNKNHEEIKKIISKYQKDQQGLNQQNSQAKLNKKINKNLREINFAVQEKQLGTGHAVYCSREHWKAENILILNGDMPLINTGLIENLIKIHEQNNATVSFVKAYYPYSETNNSAYGRIVELEKFSANNSDKNYKASSEDSKISIEIIEAKDLKQDPRDFPYINAGIYLVNREFLEQEFLNKPELEKLDNNLNTQKILDLKLDKEIKAKEIYITDLIKSAALTKRTICSLEVDFDLVRGVNTLEELYCAEKIKKNNLIKYWQNLGVRFTEPNNTQIDQYVILEPGVTIEAGVYLKGNSIIKANSLIGPYSIIDNSIIEEDSIIFSHTVIENSLIKAGSQVGPFARVHKESTIDKAVIGNFVEISMSQIGAASKAKHLTYIGNSEIGSQVNIGAGVITCNYNGISKNKTIIGDNSFIGSNSALIAPVEIGKAAIIGAGSVITKPVPDNSLAISRVNQINKLDYAPILKAKYLKLKEQKDLEDKNNLENNIETDFNIKKIQNQEISF